MWARSSATHPLRGGEVPQQPGGGLLPKARHVRAHEREGETRCPIICACAEGVRALRHVPLRGPTAVENAVLAAQERQRERRRGAESNAVKNGPRKGYKAMLL
jgi:hypothetical protein